MDPLKIRAEFDRVSADFHELAGSASTGELRRRSHGTRWTNRQLLFHMVFGFLIVRTLIPLVHVVGRLGRSRRFAAVLNAGRRPFHLINYLGSCGGGQLLRVATMASLLDRTLRSRQRRLDHETPQSL